MNKGPSTSTSGCEETGLGGAWFEKMYSVCKSMKKHVCSKDNSKSITDTNKWGRRENFPTAEFQSESGEEMTETESQP